MFKRSFVTSLLVFVTMMFLLYWGLNDTLLIVEILKVIGFRTISFTTKLGIILIEVALASYLVLCIARKMLLKEAHTYNPFAEQVWGLTVGYNIIHLFVVFYFDGIDGFFLAFYLCVIYFFVGVLWVIDYLILKFILKSSYI